MDRAAQALGDLRRVGLLGARAGRPGSPRRRPGRSSRRPAAGAHRVGDLLQDRVAGRVTEAVVDPLEVVEVAEQQRVGEVLFLGGAVELGQALLERVAVKEAGQGVDGRAAAVGAVGLNQRTREDHRAEDQRGTAISISCGGARGGIDAVGGDAEEQRGCRRCRSRSRAARSGPRGSPRAARTTSAPGWPRRRSRRRRRRAAAAGPQAAAIQSGRMGAGAHEAIGDREAAESDGSGTSHHQPSCGASAARAIARIAKQATR